MNVNHISDRLAYFADTVEGVSNSLRDLRQQVTGMNDQIPPIIREVKVGGPIMNSPSTITGSISPYEYSTTLCDMGYGFFTQFEGSDKAPIVPMLLSDDEEQRQIGIKLVGKFDWPIYDLADSIAKYGVLSPLLVRGSDDKIILGQRRFLAAIYLNAINKLKGKEDVPFEIPIIYREMSDLEAVCLVLSESQNTRMPNPMMLSRCYAELRKNQTVRQIADETCVDQQRIRQLLELNKLPIRYKQKIAEGEMSVRRGVEKVKEWEHAQES